MTEQTPSTKSLRLITWTAIRFVAFGVGGFIALWVGCVLLLDFLVPLGAHDPQSLLGIPMTLVGGLMMLFGSGQWKRWAYLWVFYSTPIVITVMAILSHYWPSWEEYVPFGKGFLPFLAPMPVSYWIVRTYYKRREAALPSSMPRVQISNNEEVPR